MKYIKKYDQVSTNYKDGDIIFLDRNKQKKHEIDNSALRLLDNINPIQMIHTELGDSNRWEYYYINVEDWYRIKFYIEPDSIKRLATPKEINNYWINQKIKKFNV